MILGLAATQFITAVSMAFIPAMKEMNPKPQVNN
jgi:hypothetical protein